MYSFKSDSHVLGDIVTSICHLLYAAHANITKVEKEELNPLFAW